MSSLTSILKYFCGQAAILYFRRILWLNYEVAFNCTIHRFLQCSSPVTFSFDKYFLLWTVKHRIVKVIMRYFYFPRIMEMQAVPVLREIQMSFAYNCQTIDIKLWNAETAQHSLILDLQCWILSYSDLPSKYFLSSTHI